MTRGEKVQRDAQIAGVLVGVFVILYEMPMRVSSTNTVIIVLAVGLIVTAGAPLLRLLLDLPREVDEHRPG